MPTRPEILLTADGSPTLEHVLADGYVEAMHNRKGALSETLYIYDDATRWLLGTGAPVRGFSMGLGLGYIEIVLVARLVREKQLARLHHLTSTESEETLRDTFVDWLRNADDPHPWNAARRLIVRLTADRYGIDEADLNAGLRDVFRSERWQITSAHGENRSYPERFNIFYYDAFSARMNPELWENAGLQSFLKTHAEATSVFVTYAATGDLKRALLATGFAVSKRIGFGGKRESLIGHKEALSPQPFSLRGEPVP